MIGGFLGAGKTISVAALAQHLREADRTVGLITNDQGRELVDTAMLRSKGFATEEIPGGLFLNLDIRPIVLEKITSKPNNFKNFAASVAVNSTNSLLLEAKYPSSA